MSETRKASGPEGDQAKVATRSKASRPAPLIRVDAALCKACGICSTLCPKQVFDLDPKGLPVAARPADCTRCRFCETHCPDFAIEVLEPSPTPDASAAKRSAEASAEGSEPAAPTAADAARKAGGR